MPAPRAIRVRLCELNDNNAYWKPLQGKSGILTEIGPDDLWDVVVEGTSAGPAVIQGVKPDRFEIVYDEAPAHEELPLRGWRGVLVSIVLGSVGAAAIIAGFYALRHHL